MTRSRYALAVAATLVIALITFLAARALSPSGRLAALNATPAVTVTATANGTSPAPPPSPTPTPTSAPPGTGTCSAAYSVVNSWPGGFQVQVVIANTGSATLNSWQLGWTFPDGQAVNDLWNGSYTQSGANVTVTNESYNGTLAPGASTTLGFNGSYSGSNTAPSSVSCT
jgi:cellulase/cellobiase CelA1